MDLLKQESTDTIMGKSELRFAILGLSVFFGCGLILALPLIVRGATSAESVEVDVFSYLFATDEPPSLALALLFLAGIFFWTWRRFPVATSEAPDTARRGWLIGGLAVAAFLYTAIGNRTIYHGYPLAMDEYLVRWAAPAFLSGQIDPSVAPTYQPYARALTPKFVMYNDQTHVWNSAYLPVHALLHALFQILGAGALLNPVLAALSIVLIAAVARRLWPDEPTAPWLAALLLATSSQFLVTGMSFYTMPSHLYLNLLWLLLYLRADRRSTLALPWIGVAALGLHYPFMHALFVVPFLVRRMRTRRPLVTLYVAAVYLLGCIVWFWWMKTFRPIPADAPAGSQPLFADSALFTWPGFRQAIWQFMALIELFSWQNLAVGLLVLAARRQLTSLPLRDLAWSLALVIRLLLFPQRQPRPRLGRPV